ncbi:MAG TPA: hypothetical protein VKC51_02135 [Lacunisphaera sp.]|nr:hypothetical protein [Lacunisphaera sp.]
MICLLLTWAAPARADYAFDTAGWAIAARFAAPPSTDAVLTPSPQGDVQATRFFLEQSGERMMLVRFVYPMAMLPGGEAGIYQKATADMLRSRPGDIRARGKFALGPYDGERLVIGQRREKTIREVRLLVIGSTFYVLSAEWPEQGTGAARAEQFFNSVKLRTEYTDPLVVENMERWRELTAGNFRLRYDATRWYRDPADREPGVFNFLRTDQKAEAQLIIEDRAIEGDIETAVLNTAREGAESVVVKKREKKLRGAVEVVELEFTARVDNVSYINHGYFYSGPEGAVQLRGWASEREYRDVSGDIGELLDGLTVGAPTVK